MSGVKISVGIGIAIIAWLAWVLTGVPLNITSGQFFFWLVCVLIAYALVYLPDCDSSVMFTGFIALIAVVVIWLIATVASSAMFNASQYQALLHVEERVFVNDFQEQSPEHIPIIDKTSAIVLGDRKLGEIVELVSQYDISRKYTQINYNGRNVRVSPLEYENPLKWFSNNSNGIPYFITVDMTTQQTTLHELEEPIMYSETDWFSRDIYRHVRKEFPTLILDTAEFEIDDDAHPFWVTPVVEYTIGFNGGEDIVGAIITDAVTGENNHYLVGEVPEWVDTLFSENLLMKQTNYWGLYVDTFWNAYFGQIGARKATRQSDFEENHGYLVMESDIWLYTGITSASESSSNLGFLLINRRTKEARYYASSGADEYSAMANAEGAVQEKEYVATFPLVINVANRPTYISALKDAAGLVKMYAFSSVEHYRIIGTGETPQQAQRDYLSKLTAENLSLVSAREAASGIITEIWDAVLDGNTQYYVRLDGKPDVYILSVRDIAVAPLLRAGWVVDIEYHPSGESTQLFTINLATAVGVISQQDATN